MGKLPFFVTPAQAGAQTSSYTSTSLGPVWAPAYAGVTALSCENANG